MALSMTTFVDFVVKAGRPKVTVVRNFKNKPEYQPAFDYYRRIREAIIKYHTDGDSIVAGVMPIPRNKKDNYDSVIKGYKKWRGKKNLEWFDPTHAIFSSNDLDISVNPELGLKINGVPHIIKLYFKADRIPKNRIEVVLELMEQALQVPGVVMSILDIQNSKLIHSQGSDPVVRAMLQAETAHWQALINAV